MMVVSKCFNMGVFLFGNLMCVDLVFVFGSLGNMAGGGSGRAGEDCSEEPGWAKMALGADGAEVGPVVGVT